MKQYEHFHSEDKKYHYLIYELCTQGSLREKLSKEGKLTEVEALAIIRAILQGLDDLQSACQAGEIFLHRDKKPENIFLDENNIKVGDLGHSIIIKDKNAKMLKAEGTPYYFSREI